MTGGAATRQPVRLPATPTATRFKPNRNWNRRYQDGHHKPRSKK